MKTKNYLNFLLALSSIGLLSACENDVYSPESIQSTKELSAPADFDWKTTASTTYTVTSPVNTTVSFYTDNTCTDESLLAEGVALKANEPAKVTLEIPTYKTSIYVQYPTENRKAVIEASTGAATRADDKNIVLPNVAEIEDNATGLVHFYYPNKAGKGTLMFEDLYPHTGDYDFNDFVIAYNVDAFYSPGSHNEFHDGFTMTFQIRAIGGSKPYRPALRLKNWKMRNLKNAKTEITSTRDDITMELLKNRGDDEDVIFVFTGTDNLRKGGFYNTRPEKIDKDFPVIKCSVTKQNFGAPPYIAFDYMNLAAGLPNYFDFFIQDTDNNNEIHFKGFGPTDMSPQDANTEYVQKGKNLVWAIAIPQLIAHPQEKVDILNVYPEFQGWVSSGGKYGKNEWYTKKPHDSVIDLD